MVYVHVPFCESFCIYCDFYSELCSRHSERRKLFVMSILDEIAKRKGDLEAASGVRTLYFGGGTPSLLDAEDIGRIAEALGGGSYDEFTVEVNPEDIVRKGTDYVLQLRDAGVSRISMGVQSFDDGILRWMGRRHDSEGALRAVDLLRRCGVDNLSLDLIFGISLLDNKTWRDTIRKTLSLSPEHISAYQLSIEEGSALASKARDGLYKEASESLCAQQYQILCGELSGYDHYEVSNWALPGHRAVHNSAYWMRKPYVGLGPGAHSFDGHIRSWNSPTLEHWTSESETLSPEDERVERIMLGLRTSDGIPESELGSATLPEGLIRTREGRIRIAEDHFFVSDSIIRQLI